MFFQKLTPRLEAVCSLVPRCMTCADIGCDHGQVSIRLTGSGRVDNMTAADVNRGPLSRAESAIATAGLSERISCVLTDGLTDLPPQDCVIIAGMGGDLIADILSRAPWTREGNRTLVLQPMTAAYRLREFLLENGYTIERETYAREREKLYVIISAKPGEDKISDMSELYISRAGQEDALAEEYVRRVIKKLTVELNGLSSGENPDMESIAHRKEAIALLEKRFC